MTDKKKYEFNKELENAWYELSKLEDEVRAAQIQIISHNHSPWTIPQCMSGLEQAPGILEQYSQPGRLLIDNIRAVFEEFIAQELSARYQRWMQQKHMERLKPQLEVAAANSIPEPDLDDISRKMLQK